MIVFDTETDGLYDECTKIHVFSWDDGETIQSTSDYDKMREIITNKSNTLVGHNICLFDDRVFKKILGVGIQGRKIDTLPVAWYIDFDQQRHGLESYGERFGIKKPDVDDWENLSYEDYKYRCEEDVKINKFLWKYLSSKLKALYPVPAEFDRIVNYLTFKMEVAGEQSDTPFFLDFEKASSYLKEIEELIGPKTEELARIMPPKVTYKTINKPKKFYKKDGSLSVAADKWFKALEEANLDIGYDEESFEVVDKTEPGNPASPDQIKSWLYSLGWEPRTYKFLRNKVTGEERQIEQVRLDGELCPSVLELVEKEPAIELLDGLTVLQHRAGVFKGFLERAVKIDCEECLGDGDYKPKGGQTFEHCPRCEGRGYLYRLRAEIAGLTNTLRFKHSKPVVNLPGVDKPWGKEIRSVLEGTRGVGLVGADMVSLESTTKKHYLWPYDPEYVKEMSEPGYDEHLSLAVDNDEITKDEYEFYSWFKDKH